MLIDRSHLSWALFSGISLIAGTASYIAYVWNTPNGPSGGSAMGMLFGIIGTLMMLFAGLLAARKPLRIRRIGSAQFWLKGHLWLGTLCIPFILFHSGFGWGGLLEQLMWYSLAVVAVSGFFGLAVHQFLPRLLWNQTPLETFEAQTPYLCDRMTFISDLRISALCESPLAVPPGHLQEHYVKLVSGFNSIVNGPGARSELNARKLLLLQQVSPPDVRDFCWVMAKYAKSEAKAIRFEGDFPELLEKTYAGLKASTVGSAPQTSPQSPPNTTPHVTEQPATALRAAAAPDKHQTEDTAANLKQPGMTGVARTLAKTEAASKHQVATPEQSVESRTPSPLTDTAAPAALNPPEIAVPAATQKLSPLEMMRKKAAEKATATAEAKATESSIVPAATVEIPAPDLPPEASAADAPKLSPLEMMKKKAAEKAKVAEPAAGEPHAEARTETPKKSSPLDMLKKNKPDANSAASQVATTLTPEPAAVKPAPARPAPAPAPAPAKMPAAAHNKPVPPTVLEKQLLQDVYLNNIREFLAENRTRRSVRRSPLASNVEARRLFHENESTLPAVLHPILNELSEFCEIRRQIEHQRQILRWMHWWLLVHVPAAVVLLVFLLAHIVMALRVIPFSN